MRRQWLAVILFLVAWSANADFMASIRESGYHAAPNVTIDIDWQWLSQGPSSYKTNLANTVVGIGISCPLCGRVEAPWVSVVVPKSNTGLAEIYSLFTQKHGTSGHLTWEINRLIWEKSKRNGGCVTVTYFQSLSANVSGAVSGSIACIPLEQSSPPPPVAVSCEPLASMVFPFGPVAAGKTDGLSIAQTQRLRCDSTTVVRLSLINPLVLSDRLKATLKANGQVVGSDGIYVASPPGGTDLLFEATLQGDEMQGGDYRANAVLRADYQ